MLFKCCLNGDKLRIMELAQKAINERTFVKTKKAKDGYKANIYGLSGSRIYRPLTCMNSK